MPPGAGPSTLPEEAPAAVARSSLCVPQLLAEHLLCTCYGASHRGHHGQQRDRAFLSTPQHATRTPSVDRAGGAASEARHVYAETRERGQVRRPRPQQAPAAGQAQDGAAVPGVRGSPRLQSGGHQGSRGGRSLCASTRAEQRARPRRPAGARPGGKTPRGSANPKAGGEDPAQGQRPRAESSAGP